MNFNISLDQDLIWLPRQTTKCFISTLQPRLTFAVGFLKTIQPSDLMNLSICDELRERIEKPSQFQKFRCGRRRDILKERDHLVNQRLEGR